MARQARKVRIWELDFLRGLALILMVIFHVLYDLEEFFGVPVEYNQGLSFFMGKISVVLFMLLAGIASTLSRNNLRRGGELLLYALIITLATHLWDPQWGIKFGILHFLGTSVLLYLLIKDFPLYLLLILATVTYGAGYILPNSVTYNFLFPLGLKAPGFISSDYYPLIPWLSVFLIGVIIGKTAYSRKQSLFLRGVNSHNPLVLIGAHTLPIYLVHQPIILLFLNLIIRN